MPVSTMESPKTRIAGTIEVARSGDWALAKRSRRRRTRVERPVEVVLGHEKAAIFGSWAALVKRRSSIEDADLY